MQTKKQIINKKRILIWVWLLVFAFGLNNSCYAIKTYREKYDSINVVIQNNKTSDNDLLKAYSEKLEICLYLPIDSSTVSETLEKALFLAKKTNAKKTQIKCTLNYSMILLQKGGFQKTIKMLEDIRPFVDSSDYSTRINLMGIQALAYTYIGEKDIALEKLDEIQILQTDTNNINIQYLLNLYGGDIYYMKGDYLKALDFYYNALSLSEKFSEVDKRRSAILSSVGTVLAYLGNTTNAMPHILEALKIYKIYGNERGLHLSYLHLGICNKNMENYEKAINYLNKTFAYSLALNDYTFIRYIYQEKAKIYTLMGKDSLSILNWEKANEINNAMGKDKYVSPSTYIKLAEVYINSGNFTKAIKNINYADNLFNSGDNSSDKCQLLTTKAKLLLAKEQLNAARLMLQKALKETNKDEQKQEIHALLETISTKQKRYKDALFHSEKEKEYRDSIYNSKENQILFSKSLQKDYEAKTRRIKYDKELMEQKKDIEIAKQHTRTLIQILLFCIICALAFSIIYYQKHKQKIKDKEFENIEKEKQIIQLQKYIEGEEQEKKRIAQELHDGIGGELALLRYKLDKIQQNSLPSDKKGILADLIHKVDILIEEVRITSFIFAPLFFNNLKESAKHFCKRIQVRKDIGIPINFQSFGKEPVLKLNTQLAIYRIVQELIDNSCKHARATNILIQFNFHANNLILIVEDDGIGFDASTIKSDGGLHAINSRIKYLNASYHIDSSNSGTSVVVTVPV